MPIELASQDRIDAAQAFFERKDWGGLWSHKNTCRKSWQQLGFTARQINTIKFYKPDWI